MKPANGLDVATALQGAPTALRPGGAAATPQQLLIAGVPPIISR
ncbi:hypothetical protein [Methylibium sp.]|nr:hypothetical protein [Methylibium sp.]